MEIVGRPMNSKKSSKLGGEAMWTNLEVSFDGAMMDIYRRAKLEAGYNATRYFQMLTEHRGLETARILLHAANVSEGYTALWERGRLDLTVEALIHDHPEYQPLFTPEEREIGRRRLQDYSYAPAIDPLEQFIGALPTDVPDWTSQHDKYVGQSLMDEMCDNRATET
jgi:hypothetical protein